MLYKEGQPAAELRPPLVQHPPERPLVRYQSQHPRPSRPGCRSRAHAQRSRSAVLPTCHTLRVRAQMTTTRALHKRRYINPGIAAASGDNLDPPCGAFLCRCNFSYVSSYPNETQEQRRVVLVTSPDGGFRPSGHCTVESVDHECGIIIVASQCGTKRKNGLEPCCDPKWRSPLNDNDGNEDE